MCVCVPCRYVHELAACMPCAWLCAIHVCVCKYVSKNKRLTGSEDFHFFICFKEYGNLSTDSLVAISTDTGSRINNTVKLEWQ